MITPAGQLNVGLADDKSNAAPSLDTAVAKSLVDAFRQSSADGLLHLASGALHVELPAALVYWREFAQRFFHEVCGLSQERFEEAVTAQHAAFAAPPDDETLNAIIDNAPPMRGLEYLTAEVLRNLWTDLAGLVVRRAGEHPEGATAFLRSVNPLWNLLGRVTFHLAENKRDAARPFAFLATYAHRMSARAKLQHLPLAEALKHYAGQQNKERLAALLAPVRRAASESTLVRELLDSKALFQPQALSIQAAHRFLTQVPAMENSGLVVRVPDWWKPRNPTRPEVQVRLGQKQASQVGMESLLDFSIELALDGEPLSDEERQQILDSTDGLLLLRGKWVEVDQHKLQQALDHWEQIEQEHAGGVDFIKGMRMLAGVRMEQRDDEDAVGWSRVAAGDWLRDTLAHIRDPSGVVECEPGIDLNATLRPYQVDGVRWLWFLTRLGLGACLADDMGLGKTIQVIDLLLMLKRENAGRDNTVAAPPSLLIVPASLVGNWKSEFERFAPSLDVFYAHRSESDAAELQRVADDPDSLAEFDVAITTYGMVRRMAWVGEREWRLVVLDEAQAIKNASSVQARAVRKLRSSGRIALSGTPVENHLGELWSLFEFCCPGLLGNASQFKKFVKKLNQLQDSQAYGALRRLVRPYILRRLKTDRDIAPDLPDKTEMRAECGLSKKQVTLYRKTLDDLERRLDSLEGIERRGLVLTSLMQLKQICNHPSQFLGQGGYEKHDSGKFQRLELICQPIVERQERVLIFTQFQALTEPLAEFLAEVFGRRGLVLHGGVPVKKRKELVRQFQSDDGPPFFVISVKAGGTGLNLTAASHVVHFDRWWNPAVENQATDRAFRIGQMRNVLVHKFVCRGTVEERIDQMIRDKQQLADEILSGGAEAKLTEMNDAELMAFVAIDLSRAAVDD
ncbi:MAG: DEAD/DEAH box helicase [Planctomycetota bacterium]|nr:DEAD/DEAH box helicase [Planctomycetota bacterium]